MVLIMCAIAVGSVRSAAGIAPCFLDEPLSTATRLKGRVHFDRPPQVSQGGFRTVAVDVVNGGRERVVIHESV